MLAAVSIVLLLALQVPPLEKLTLPGASNVTRVDAVVMCAGSTAPGAFPAIKRFGVKSVLNLRREHEPGVDIEAARAAAAANGLVYIHIPVDAASPSSESVDAFLEAVTSPANQPVYIHCGSANRVAAMWMIKRVVVDKWEAGRAHEEARAIGLTSAALEKFVFSYLGSRTR